MSRTAGLDKIPGSVLGEYYAHELAVVFANIFNLSQEHATVPVYLKKILIMVHKQVDISSMSN